MKAIMLITDSEVMPEFERGAADRGPPGVHRGAGGRGSGRHGLKTGDRVHPGSSSLLLTVAAEGTAAGFLALLRRARDEGGHGDRTRLWSFAVEEAD